jgi:3-methyladenine DNA glycosylase AlkC
MLRVWVRDPNPHVRRLVSEGTRPRLPWAGRLRGFQEDPLPVLALLEELKDDPELYVRRSVANNLNDIGKDHPEVLVDVARRWMFQASAERKALVRHALRSLVKEGHADALKVLGFGPDADVTIEDVTISPKRVAMGGKVVVAFTVRSTARRGQRVLVDLRVHFVRAAGKASPKVFKLKAVDLATGTTTSCRKTVSLADLTTRQHYPGKHLVDALVNGRVMPIGAFTLTEKRRP